MHPLPCPLPAYRERENVFWGYLRLPWRQGAMHLRLTRFILFVVVYPIAALAQPIPISVNLAAPGTHFNPGVRGQAAPCINMYRPGATTGNAMAFDVARG